MIAGYTPTGKNFDALIIGYHEGDKLICAARTRNGFTPASRVELFKEDQAAGAPLISRPGTVQSLPE